jgi:hypothetical protein
VNIHAVLRTALGSLAAGGYHPNVFPQEDRAPTWPAIRGTLVNTEQFPDQCGTDAGESDDLDVQLDVVSLDYDEMYALAGDGGAVRLALLEIEPRSLRQGYFETFDRETKTHRGVLTYRFFQSSRAGSP